MDHGLEEGTLSTLLTDRRRRYLIYSLLLYSTPQRLPRIADQLTVWETGDPVDDRLDDRLQIYMSLYHDHLPDLIDAGVVEYRQETDTVDWATEITPEMIGPRTRETLCDEIDELLEAESGTFETDRETVEDACDSDGCE